MPDLKFLIGGSITEFVFPQFSFKKENSVKYTSSMPNRDPILPDLVLPQELEFLPLLSKFQLNWPKTEMSYPVRITGYLYDVKGSQIATADMTFKITFY